MIPLATSPIKEFKNNFDNNTPLGAKLGLCRRTIYSKLSTSRSQFGPNFEFQSRQLLLSTRTLYFSNFVNKYFCLLYLQAVIARKDDEDKHWQQGNSFCSRAVIGEVAPTSNPTTSSHHKEILVKKCIFLMIKLEYWMR